MSVYTCARVWSRLVSTSTATILCENGPAVVPSVLSLPTQPQHSHARTHAKFGEGEERRCERTCMFYDVLRTLLDSDYVLQSDALVLVCAHLSWSALAFYSSARTHTYMAGPTWSRKVP